MIIAIEKIVDQARRAVDSGSGMGANPYPEHHPAHEVWQKYYCAFATVADVEAVLRFTGMRVARNVGMPMALCAKYGGRTVSGAYYNEIDPFAAQWPTPTTNCNPQPETRRGLSTLAGQSRLAGWTPTSRDWKDSGVDIKPRVDGSARLDQLPRKANLAGWPTTTSTDSRRCGQLDENAPNKTLNHSVQLAAATTGIQQADAWDTTKRRQHDENAP